MRRGGLGVLALVVALTASASRSANADPAPADRVAARILFDDARALMKSRAFREACPKLEESQRLDPGVGTLFNLADCFEGLGRLASAWTIFLDVAEASTRAGEGERARVAKARADAIAARLPHVRVTTGSPAPSLALDGRPFATPLIDTLVPIDPGEHVIGADAPAKEHWERVVHAAEGATVTVAVPALEDAPSPLAPLEAVGALSPTPAPAPPATSPSHWRIPVAIATAGVGVLGLALGSIFGVEASSDWSDAKPDCPNNRCATPGAYSAWQSAHSAGIASTASFLAGGALVGVGAVVWLTTPKAPVRVGASPDGALVVSGRFP